MAATTFNSSEQKGRLTFDKVHTKLKYTKDVIFHVLPQY